MDLLNSLDGTTLMSEVKIASSSAWGLDPRIVGSLQVSGTNLLLVSDQETIACWPLREIQFIRLRQKLSGAVSVSLIPHTGKPVTLLSENESSVDFDACDQVSKLLTADTDYLPLSLSPLGEDLTTSSSFAQAAAWPSVISGGIQKFEGMSGLAKGSGTLTFGPTAVELVQPTRERPVQISYQEITSLQIGGRGNYSTSAGFRIAGAGFGLGNALKAMMEAELVNIAIEALTTRRHTESLVGLDWPKGRLVLVNSKYEPEVLATALRPVILAIEAIQDTQPVQLPAIGEPQRSISEELASVAALFEAGHLSEEEFSLAKAQILGR